MKKLFLLRHAEASNDLGADDHDRSLTPNGLNQASKVGGYLKNHNYMIDLVLCSSARRTKMTLKGLQDGGAVISKKEYSDTLYNAPASHLMNELFGSSGDNVLIIAHNPGIHQFSGLMVQKGDPEYIERLMFGYAPATLSIFECPFNEWADASENKSTLIDLFTPS